MTDDSVIIIGAGLAGLAAGCFCQMNGYRCRIFEHHAQAGGVAAHWRRGDYLIDGGIHFVMGHKPGTGLYELYRQLGIVPAVRIVDMTTYGRFIDETSGLQIDLTADLERFRHEAKALFAGDDGVIDPLVNGAQAMQGLDMSTLGLASPPELSTPLGQLRDLWAMRRLLPYLVGKYGRSVAEYVRPVEDARLRALIESLFLPEVPVFFAQMMLALVADGQVGLLEGGCRDFVGAIEKRFLALGGKIAYNSTVDKILTESAGRGRNRAVGVRLANGDEHRAGAVVSAGDGHRTIFAMLGGSYVNERIRKRYATWPMFAPLLMVSFGVAREFPDELPFTTIVLHEPLTVGTRPVERLFVRVFNYSRRFAPLGRSVIQVEFETEWDFWNDLHANDHARYEGEKERVADAVLQRLERRFAGLSRQVEVVDVATPYTTWRYTLNHRGAWEGWMITPQVFSATIERTLPGLDDFYMAGQWVMAGGGVPPVLYAGQHVAQLLCRRDGKTFRATT